MQDKEKGLEKAPMLEIFSKKNPTRYCEKNVLYGIINCILVGKEMGIRIG